MKKLLIALTAAVAGVFASTATADESLPTGVGFDDVAAESSLVIDSYWTDSTDAGATKVVKAWGENEWPEGIGHPQSAGTPDANYLSLKTAFGNPIFRKAFTSGAPAVTDGKIFFDSMVKFTATDGEPEMTAYAGSKLMVYVIDNSEDESTAAYTTNLMVVAKNAAGEPTTYDLGEIDVDVWHRLTIKAVQAFANNNELAFTVYVDQAPKHTPNETPIYTDTSALTTEAKGINAAGRLFPSLVACTTITEVGFDGQGCIDDLAFADSLIDETWADEREFVLTKDENITSFDWVCKSAGEPVASGTATDMVRITAVKNMTVVISNPVFAEGQWKLAAEEMSEDLNFADNIFSGFGSASSVAKLVANDVTPRVSVTIGEGDPQTFPSLVEAFKVINAQTTGDVLVQLNESLELGSSEIPGMGVMVSDCYITTEGASVTIDLNGKTLTGPADADVITCSTPATIIDTKGTGKVIPAAGMNAVLYVDTLAIAGGTFDGAVVSGDEAAEITAITGGSFDVETNSANGDFKFKDVLTTDYVYAKDTDKKYWVVSPAPKAGVILTTTHATVTGVKTGDEFAENGEIEFTVAPETYYDMPTVTVGSTVVTPDEEGNYTYTVTAADVEGKTLNISVVATATEWTITYYNDDDLLDPSVFAEETYSVESGTLNAGTKDGYTFNGWTDVEGYSVTSLEGKTGDLELYGSWTPIPYVAQIGSAKYETIEAAVAAANEDDTIVLLADCAIDGDKATTLEEGKGKIGLYITKNLTIDAEGDYTLTGPSGAYGIVVGGGATLTLKGGTIKELSTESRSIVNVGNAAGGDFAAEAFTGNLVLDGATIKGAGADTTAGNAIAAANGTVTITSGTVTDIGSRGVKAEGTATITINGGTITSNGTKPALYAKESGSITVNGGTIDGVIQNAATSTATITIPGDSTATFDRAQSYCATGYKTLLDEASGRYVVKPAKAVTVKAGEGIKSVMAGGKDLTLAFVIQPTDYDTEVTLTAVDTITTPVFKIAVNGDAAIPVTSPFKLSDYYITYETIVEGAEVVFTAEEGAAPITPVDPESPATDYGTPEKAADAAKAINENKETYINSPAEAPVGFDHGEYVKNFEAVVVGTQVEVKLTEKAQSDLQAQVNSDVVEKIKPAELAAKAGEATLVTTPGFYYTVVAGNGIGTMAPKSCTFAAGAETKVDLPSFSGAGFYTIKVTVKRVEIPAGE